MNALKRYVSREDGGGTPLLPEAHNICSGVSSVDDGLLMGGATPQVARHGNNVNSVHHLSDIPDDHCSDQSFRSHVYVRVVPQNGTIIDFYCSSSNNPFN